MVFKLYLHREGIGYVVKLHMETIGNTASCNSIEIIIYTLKLLFTY